MNTREFFHLLSYTQYPMMLFMAFFAIYPIITGDFPHNVDAIWKSLNLSLFFGGLGISISTLQDTTKTQNKFSKDIWENPKRGKRWLAAMGVMALVFVGFGITGLIWTSESPNPLNELALGFLALGIAQIGLLRSGIEMFENHRKDR